MLAEMLWRKEQVLVLDGDHNCNSVFSLNVVTVLTELWYLLLTSFALLNVFFLQIQANQWIRQMENVNGLKTVKLTDSNCMHILESGIRTGTPVLLEDAGETLDSALGPVLMKQTFFQVCLSAYQNLLNKYASY